MVWMIVVIFGFTIKQTIMITILLFAIIGLIYAVRKSMKDSWHGTIDHCACAWFGIMFGGFAGLTIAFSLPMKLKDEVTNHGLGALQDNIGLHGAFFLGTGNVDSKPVYSYYSEYNGMYELKQVPTVNSYIKYTVGAPRLVIVKKIPFSGREHTMNFFALDSEMGDKTYIFEVPKGSIANNYELDAK